jgi:hypothetical protein
MPLTLIPDQIATAFIHLLASALDELSSPCLSDAWTVYVCPSSFVPFQSF